jgi:NAD(P)-dependent dehydrogenase (short-subunit alcohol dehydrogenase family)
MQTVIVTGATGNMGQGIVQKFLADGYRVIGTAFSKKHGSDIQQENFELHTVDLTEEVQAREFIDGIVAKYAGIDAVVATVGGFAMGSIAETGLAHIYEQLKLNFDTAYNTVRPCFLQMMRQKKGKIFLVGSRPGLDARDSTGMMGYSLAKALVIRLAEILNLEAKGTGVVACVIVPGTINTPQNRRSMPGKDFESWVTPEEIAEVVSFYCSDAGGVIREPIIKLYNKS